MTTALYRRYRPETFEDVIGQEHVTEPLMTALRKDRVSHAYLFSGPRGCGKTTSARILARCLNCAEGPTPTPCGRCESCRDLARDGAGSLDVIEMDAASHGGVDHARDLRERATFAPVRDRFKIFIIDEAHMVTREGFNALLKIVEEPPEHIKFIFATTEPSKVLTTIRSRTHHYPFRLVPTEPLMHYLERLCAEEHVEVAPGVLSLVVRAGGGSVRDTLSVLDQLMAGSDERGVGYDLAVALLGYTHGALLDDVVDAFASGDAATVFRAVDRVVQTGQDPRRFVEDLLERFRDLIIVNAVPESAGNILHGMPQDQIARLRNQASQLGAAELSRAADITNTALTEMTGATSPQLHLELLCARILLPSSEDTTRGVTARVDRLERRLSIGRGTAPVAGHEEPAAAAPPSAGRGTAEPVAVRAEARSTAAPSGAAPSAPERPDPARTAVAAGPSATGPAADGPSTTGSDTDGPDTGERTRPGAPRGAEDGGRPEDRQPPAAPHQEDTPAAAPPEPAAGEGTPLAPGGSEIELLRASWPEIVNALADIRRVAWFTVQRGTPQSFDGKVLRIMFDAEGDLMNFPRFEDDLRQAVQQVLGIDCRAEAVPPGGGHGRGGGGAPRGPEPAPRPSGQRGGPRTDTQRPAPPAAPADPPARGGADRRPPGPAGPDGAVEQRTTPSADSRNAGSRSADAPRSSTEGPGTTSRIGAPEEPSRSDGPRGGQDAWHAHGRPATDAPAEWTDPAWAEEPVHSWSVAAIPQSGASGASSAPPAASSTGTGTPAGTGTSTGTDTATTAGTPAASPAEHPDGSPAEHPGEPRRRTAPGDAAVPAGEPGRSGDPGGGAPTTDPAAPPPRNPAPAPAGPGGGAGRDRPSGRPSGGTGARPDGGGSPRGRDRAPFDDVPPPEEPPHPDEPPFPDDLDEAPPEQWRPAQPHRTGRPAPAREAAVPESPAASAAGAAPRQASPRSTPGNAAPRDLPGEADRRERLSFRERHAAAIAAGRQAPDPGAAADRDGGVEWDDSFVPSSDDEALEDSTLYGRAAIERILGGMLIEERDLHAGE
ncbi:DNA polymerase III subunit gamma and tau [Kocuria sp. KH4]